MSKYLVPAEQALAKVTIQGSKFIAQIFPVPSREEAEARYLEVKKQYHDATHNCFAYRITTDDFRYSDDGEPSGTAGRPILQVLDGAHLFEVLCVVTRYFGGTKLGTGGLIKAYSGVAKEALRNLRIVTKTLTRQLKIKLDYQDEKYIFRLLDKCSGKLIDGKYTDQIIFHLELPCREVDYFLKEIKELTHGRALIVD